jgi:dTDP-4-amino-4,6-dideoxygalactose transaminase
MGDGAGEKPDPSRTAAAGGGLAVGRGQAAIAEHGSHVPFNRPFATGAEFEYLREAIDNGHLSGSGPFSRRCSDWLEQRTGANTALLTHSATAALEMAALLLEVGPGDEVVVPSFSFPSTAGAFALRGATVVFADIRADTLNLDEREVEEAITDRTRAIVPVHYAGVACELDAIRPIAERHRLVVVEDAAQALLATYKGRPLGAIGDLGALSFHETKNVMCGEGGALLLRGDRFVQSAEIIQEKGTNRREFYRGQVDKYTWVQLGSSYAPSEINAAFLWAQLEHADAITEERLRIWGQYHEAFSELEERGDVRRPVVPEHCGHNAHLYYLLAPDEARRDALIAQLGRRDVNAVFHYVPLHESPAGARYGRAVGALATSVDVSSRLLRLPLWVGMNDSEIDRVVGAVYEGL